MLGIERTDDFYTVLVCAVRYSVGRRTYMPDLVTRWIMANAPEIPKNYAQIMMQDIDLQRRNASLGDECDVATWLKFYNWLERRVIHDGKPKDAETSA